jgi:hypothetical protein
MGMQIVGARLYYYRKIRRGKQVTSIYVASGAAALAAETALIELGKHVRREPPRRLCQATVILTPSHLY